jgi:hypothetical protein
MSNRYAQAALNIPTATHAQKLVLFALAIRMNRKSGSCFERYEQLQFDTGLSRRHLNLALKYLRDELKVLTWKRGHSARFSEDGKGKANEYTFTWWIMKELAEKGAENRLQLMKELAGKATAQCAANGRKDTPTVRTEEQAALSQESGWNESSFCQNSGRDFLTDAQNAERPTMLDSIAPTDRSVSSPEYSPPNVQVAQQLRALEVDRLNAPASRVSTVLHQIQVLFKPRP